MEQNDINEIIKTAHKQGFADRRSNTEARRLSLKSGRKELFITIVPCSNSILYAANLPLHCFGGSGLRWINDAQAGIRLINALVTRFEYAKQNVKKKYKILD